ncbi:hypothetical protein G9A89_019069 [Geosiphon pyriformis]|nr:hypothetical protein G9A89_019069 [Geosiphon pyriformis]
MASLLRFSVLRAFRPYLGSHLKPSFKQATAPTRFQCFPYSIYDNLLINSTRTFSTNGNRLLSNGLVDKSLADQLIHEIKTETENSSHTTDTPDFIKEFLNRQTFKIEDKPGHDEVAITRTFGNERLRLLFSVTESPSSATNSYSDDEYEGENGSSSDENAEDEDVLSDESFPIRCVLTVEKENKGALAFELTCEDGIFIIDSISYYKDGKLANDLTVEGDWKRRRLYLGPRFDNLDNEVQILFERYLEERSIDTSLALFIPNYVDYKEQKEYIGWLRNVMKFVQA